MTLGWIIGAFFTLMTGLTMAEICSTYPSAGSVYYWAGALSPMKWAPLSSYVTGWFNLIGNSTFCSSIAYGIASMASISNHFMGGEYFSVE
jgi:amino acid transporter